MKRASAVRLAALVAAAATLLVAAAAWRAVRPVPVKALAPVRKDVAFTVPVDGVVRAGNMAGVRCPVNEGRVRRVFVREGDLVYPGQPLVEMEDAAAPARARRAAAWAELSAAMAEARSPSGIARRREEKERRARKDMEAFRRLDEAVARHFRAKQWAMADLERARKAGSSQGIRDAEMRIARASREIQAAERRRYAVSVRTGLSSPWRLDEARADLAEAERALRVAKREMPDPVLRSTVRGLVAAVGVKPGDRVSRYDPLVRVADLDALQVSVPLPEGAPRYGGWDSPLFNLLHPAYARARSPYTAAIPGADAEVTSTAIPEMRLAAQVTSSYTREDGRECMLVSLRGRHKALRPGTPVRVGIIRSRHPGALTLPRTAILDPEGDAAVLVVRGGRIVKQPVKVAGYERPEYVIREGLRDGDLVAASPATLRPGRRARFVRHG